MYEGASLHRRAVAGAIVALLAGAAAAPAQVLDVVQILHDGVDVPALNGPRMVVVSPDGGNVYVAAEQASSITVYRRDHHDGTLTQVQVLTDGVDGVDGLRGTGSLTISPDGRNVYAGGFFESAVAVFARDPHTGLLHQIQLLREGIEVADGLQQVTWALASQDGRNVYFAGFNDDAVVVFRRDAHTGLLSFEQLVENGLDGIDRLDGPFQVVLSPNGRSVYVCALNDDAVSVFDRDPSNGRLSRVQVVQDQVDGVTGLDRVRALYVSRDGHNVYAGSILDFSIVTFDRDPADGTLTFRQDIRRGNAEVIGLAGNSFITSLPGDGLIFTAGFLDEAVGVFGRHHASGLLTYVENQLSSDFLSGVISLDASPDGRYLYAVSFLSDTLTVFSIDR